MAETHPYRHALTGLVQELTDDAASVFANVLERLPDNFQEVFAEKELAEAKLAAALEEGSARTKAAQEAKAQVEQVQQVIDQNVTPAPVTPATVPPPTDESGAPVVTDAGSTPAANA